MSRAEKFIQDYTRNCSNECCGEGINVGHGVTLSKRCFTPWLTPDQARRAVEIEREEVIERACDAHCRVCGRFIRTVPAYMCRQDCEDFERFKQAMKDG